MALSKQIRLPALTVWNSLINTPLYILFPFNLQQTQISELQTVFTFGQSPTNCQNQSFPLTHTVARKQTHISLRFSLSTYHHMSVNTVIKCSPALFLSVSTCSTLSPTAWRVPWHTSLAARWRDWGGWTRGSSSHLCTKKQALMWCRKTVLKTRDSWSEGLHTVSRWFFYMVLTTYYDRVSGCFCVSTFPCGIVCNL